MEETEFSPETKDVALAFPDLKLNHSIGSGGQKLVFKALWPEVGEVALKLIRPGGPEVSARTIRELQAIKSLKGPWFPTFYDSGERLIGSDNVIYLVEEFINGDSLRSLIQKEKCLPLKLTALIGERILEALVEVEKIPLVHRDIKPENIMVSDGERIILLDFGIARHIGLKSLTHDEALCGPMTLGYSAPEQILNQKRKICPRTDLFALGILIYECLSGLNPFLDGSITREEVMKKCLELDPPPLTTMGFAEGISNFVKSCMDKRVHRRPASAKKALTKFKEVTGN